MKYNPDNLIITFDNIAPWRGGPHIEILAENLSSIKIRDISISYQSVENDGTVIWKSTQVTTDISSGEKRLLLSHDFSGRSLNLTDITVTADDGSIFKVQPPQEFRVASCFVTTAAFGNANHPIVVTFRELRDEVLINHKIGRAFIDWYNREGPKLAEKLNNKPVFRATTRIALRPLAIAVRSGRSAAKFLSPQK